jgi:hypothetical protein
VNFQIQLTGLPEAKEKLALLRSRLQNLSPVIKRIGVMELASAQGRIETGGDGSWAPTAESSFGSTLNRTGTLLRSLTVGGGGNLFEDIDHGVRVGTNLTSPDGWSIGEMMQKGTGIYGRGTPIEPLNGKKLAFMLNGRPVFAHEVKGSPPRKFLFISDEDARRAVEIAKNYIQTGAT